MMYRLRQALSSRLEDMHIAYAAAAELRAHLGGPRTTYLRDMYGAFMRHQVRPKWFAGNALYWRPKADWGDFIDWDQMRPFWRKTIAKEAHRRCFDKGVAEVMLRQAGIPMPPLLATILRDPNSPLPDCPNLTDVAQTMTMLNDLRPHGDLVIKPFFGCGGDGFFIYRTDQTIVDGFGRAITPDELRQRIRDFRMEGMNLGFQVQALIKPDAQITQLSGTQALSTLRIVTAQKNGEAWVIGAALKLIAGDSLIDNFHGGGFANLLVAIDRDTGALGQAYGRVQSPYEFILQRWDHHPKSGAKITDVALACWPQARDLACQAARANPDITTLGFDIAATDEGCLVLDQNTHWGPEVIQAASGIGCRPLLRALAPGLV